MRRKKRIPKILIWAISSAFIISIVFFCGYGIGIIPQEWIDAINNPSSPPIESITPSPSTNGITLGDVVSGAKDLAGEAKEAITNTKDVLSSMVPDQTVLPSLPTSEVSGQTPSQVPLHGELLYAHYIDVGQADASFIELPNGECMLIDGGNRGDGDLVVQYIKELGYSTIDYVVASHPDEDHIGGLPDVFDSFVIDSIYMPSKTSKSKIFQELMRSIEAEGITPTYVSSQTELFQGDDLEAFTLGPNMDYKDPNSCSIILKLIYGGNSFLFTGDATVEAESDIVGDPSADVLKVGHHGSETSSSLKFLKKVTPEIAVISVGEGNIYGHPHQEVIYRLKKLVSTLLRTDEVGTIIITSDGAEIAYSTSK